jgi:hypothetical protein
MTEWKADIQKLLKHLSDQLPELDAETRGIQMFGAPRLNAFAIFEPDERRVNRILADLLDPKGRHGQGELFLNIFLRAVDLPELRRGGHVTVSIDDKTSQGRLIDITVSTDDAIMGIEVKLWSSQQKDQLKDYEEHLKNAARGRCSELVFLADQEPETAKDVVIRMPWAKPLENGTDHRKTVPLADILIAALPKIRAVRTRTIVEDFLYWINEEFGGTAMSNGEYDAYINAGSDAFDNANTRRALGVLLMATETLHHKVLNAIGEASMKGLSEIADDFMNESAKNFADCLSEKDGNWFFRRRSWPANLGICVEAQKKNFESIIFGVCAPDRSHPEIVSEGKQARPCDARKQLDAAFALSDLRPPKSTAHWPWYDFCQTRTWGIEFSGKVLLESPNGVIADHPEIKAMIEKLVALARIADKAVSPS